MNKIKVVHIHTDAKFIDAEIERFSNEKFENNIIFSGKRKQYKGKFASEIKIFKRSEADKILAECNRSDLVVFYHLNPYKTFLITKIKSSVKIAWRFFGAELYKKMPEVVFSPKTLKAMKVQEKRTLNNIIIDNLKIFKASVLGTKIPLVEIYSVFDRIDYMLVISNEEYNFLKTHWDNLPKFMKLPKRVKDLNFTLPENKFKDAKEKPLIIVGNNRSSYNNHLDILEIIQENRSKENYSFYLLFNYGQESNYTGIIRSSVKNKKYISLIENYIDHKEFNSFYEKADALVINGYRQMASANIFLALRNGAKIYLNTKNPHYYYLKNEGFKIFSIEDFKDDLEYGKVSLEKGVAQHNLDLLLALPKKYSVADFQEKILRIL